MKKSMILIICILLLTAFVGCGTNTNQDDPAEKTLQVDIDAEKVARIGLYWDYRSYTVWREDSSSLIDNTIELLNGEYVVCARWTNNGTGSGDHISLYDSEGDVLKTYYVFRSEDGPFSIWEEGTEHFNYQRDESRDDLREIVEMITLA